MFLSDQQWLLLQPLFPASSRGRPPLDDRLILELIFQKLTQHLPWYNLPTTTPSWQACYQRYHRWKVTGIWKSIIHTLFADLADRGGLILPDALENHTISIVLDGSPIPTITFSPEMENTWQQTTANLLIHLISAEHKEQ